MEKIPPSIAHIFTKGLARGFLFINGHYAHNTTANTTETFVGVFFFPPFSSWVALMEFFFIQTEKRRRLQT
jgi:hypothetical protein